ncbi:MAG: hypothetical protein Q9N34_02735 [Aquificota bacterium]|nr:hypothetical protein [Aquificota bacterium]
MSGEEPKEVRGVMSVPMVVLGVMSVVVGFGEGWYMGVMGEEGGVHMEVAVISVLVGLVGIGVAYMVYVRGVVDPGRAYESLRGSHTAFREQFFTEKLYHKVLAWGYLSYSRILYSVGERQLIDGIVNGVAYITQSVGRGMRFLQGGKLNWYAVSLTAGFGVLVVLILGLTVGGL